MVAVGVCCRSAFVVGRRLLSAPLGGMRGCKLACDILIFLMLPSPRATDSWEFDRAVIMGSAFSAGSCRLGATPRFRPGRAFAPRSLRPGGRRRTERG